MEPFNRKEMLKFIKQENDRIMEKLIIFNVPETIEDNVEDYLLPSSKNLQNGTAGKGKKQAADIDELEDRLNIIRNKMKSKKKPITERAQKKREAKKLKKNKEFKKVLVSAAKSMKNENHKLSNGVDDNSDVKKDVKMVPIKPVFNQEGKIVFSKFDFAAHPGAKAKRSHQNPREMLKKINETNKKLKTMVEEGETDKAAELKSELAWKKAFDKIEGKKVKDDPKLLVKAIKKRKVEKKKSKQKWGERKEKVETEINARQKKRNENISKRIKDKKNKKLKNLSKRGRVVPGF